MTTPVPNTTSDLSSETYDVIVVGAGNAGFSAASTACQALRSLYSQTNLSTNTTPSASSSTTVAYTPKVLLLEKASHSKSGGNTFYTAGAYRFCFDSLSDLRPILSQDGKRGIPDDLAARIEMAPYRYENFMGDLDRVTSGRADPELAKVLVGQSREAVNWIAENGGQWELSFHRQAYEVDGKFKFWGGLVVCFAGGGKGLVEWHERLAEREGVEVRYDTAVVDLIVDEDVRASKTHPKVIGVEVQTPSNSSSSLRHRIISKGGVILATGGFQANPALRTRWLGPSWRSAHVRGSSTNTGDGHALTLLSPSRRVRAKAAGHYPGCHSVCWDASSPPDGGDRILTNQYTKSGYPLGIMVNARGKRFVDEGADLRNYTYAIFGREVLKQSGGVAWQIWDAECAKLLRKEEYDGTVTELVVANSLQSLAEKLSRSGLKNTEGLLDTISEFNEACTTFQKEHADVQFDPSKKDGLSTQSSVIHLALAKSNWARPLLNPPFTAVKITCGVTFTFGGLAVRSHTAEVIADDERTDGYDESEGNSLKSAPSSAQGEVKPEGSRETEQPIEGLYCCGELMGGLFWDNYPGGSGLTAGTVFGRIAGKHAAERAARMG